MTTPSKEAQPVEVTQADREEAAEFLFEPHTNPHRRMRGKGADDHPLVQAFARHRLATLPPQDSSGDARELVERLRNASDNLSGNEPSLSVLQLAADDAANFIEAALSRQNRPEGVGDAERVTWLRERVQLLYEELSARLTYERYGNLWCELCCRDIGADGTDHDESCLLNPYSHDAKMEAAALRSQDRPVPDADAILKGLETISVADEDNPNVIRLFVRIDHVGKALREALASRSAPDGWVLPAELRELSEKATAGVWSVNEAMTWAVSPTICECFGENVAEANAAFIAAAVNFVRQALATSPSALSGEGVE